MSASPPQQTHSTKRPLEEPSSPSRAGDQPEAKRPALDKAKNNDEAEMRESVGDSIVEALEQNGEEVNGATEDAAAEVTAEAATEATAEATAEAANESDVLAVEAGADVKNSAATVAAANEVAINSATAHDESSWIHIRAVISSPEAATVIGKGGENVSNIRKMSNAKCTVSDYQKGAVERILTVSGIVDAVAKVNTGSGWIPRKTLTNVRRPSV